MLVVVVFGLKGFYVIRFKDGESEIFVSFFEDFNWVVFVFFEIYVELLFFEWVR